MNQVLININRLGWSLKEGDIDIVLEMIKKEGVENKYASGEFSIHKHFANQLMKFLEISPDTITRSMLECYAKMSPQDLYIPFTLSKPEIIEQRIIAPLVSAKKLACLGEFLASVSLSGVVGEMLAVFVWEMNAEDRVDKHGNPVEDRKLLVEGFSQMPQNQRINILQAFGYIDSVQVGKFKELTSRRNNILHSWTDSLRREEIENYAIICYSCAAFLMKGILEIELANAGSLKVSPKVMAYIKRHGG